jgi:5-(carboxyamino)imidazole ribonucleotide synthase
MFALAARRMGYRVHTFSPDTDTPAGQISDVEWAGSFEDLELVRDFARRVHVATFEFENVPFAATEAVAQFAPVRPRGEVLHTTQQRIREKTFLRSNGFPVAPFHIVRTIDDLNAAVAQVGIPAILKSAGFGYDGKGQVALKVAGDAAAAWDSIGRCEAVMEARIDLEQELSVVAARGYDGTFAHYGLLANKHHEHILDVTVSPARIAPGVYNQAVEAARAIVEKLEVVGVLCVEFFLATDGRLLINELAPRPHNSGHFTIDACVTSQFEQQLRTVCGLPLGSTEQHTPAAMANLLGDLWTSGEPDWVSACSDAKVKLHLYGKSEARPRRKMGHITALASDACAAEQIAVAARERLLRKAL